MAGLVTDWRNGERMEAGKSAFNEACAVSRTIPLKETPHSFWPACFQFPDQLQKIRPRPERFQIAAFPETRSVPVTGLYCQAQHRHRPGGIGLRLLCIVRSHLA